MSPKPTSPTDPSEAARGDAAAETAVRAGDPLERLRDRVERAAVEIERLRMENARLAERVAELARDDEAAPAAGPALLLEGDDESLRDQIQGFIDALDAVLAERHEADTAPASDEPA